MPAETGAQCATEFATDISSRITVPGEGRTRLGGASALGLRALVAGLRAGAMIEARHDLDAPIRCQPRDAAQAQILTCQTSGSTGAPKVIRRSARSWIASFEVTRGFGVSAQTPYAVLGALGHSLTLYGVLEALHLGADLTVLAGLGARAQLRALRQQDTAVLYATPTQLRLLLEVEEAPLPALHLIFSGGGKLDARTRAGLAALCPNATLREFFGTSEASFVTISDAESDAPEGSVGRAYPGCDIRLDQAGELWVKSPYLFDGYADEVTGGAVLRDGFLSTGEMAQIDAAGHVTLLGRRDRMITIADQNVYPERVEAQLLSHANVGKSAVIPVFDALRGQTIVGIVEGAPDEALAEQLRSDCRAALGAAATPRRIVFVDALPLLPAGKPDLQALSQMIEAGL